METLNGHLIQGAHTAWELPRDTWNVGGRHLILLALFGIGALALFVLGGQLFSGWRDS